jgi:hypothetical protein
MIGCSVSHVNIQGKRFALTLTWAKLGAYTLHADVATVTLEELPTIWRGQAMSPQVKYEALLSQSNERQR